MEYPRGMTEDAPAILVTGSSRGIGAAIVSALGARGVRVIGHGRRAAPGQVGANLAEPGAARLIWDQAMEISGGRIDAVVNNAGIFLENPIGVSDFAWLDGWEETLRVNLTAAAELSRLAVRHWLDRGASGRLIHVASRAAHRGDSADHWHYAAAKGGMIAMHKTIARAYAGVGIHSYAISPGFVETAMARPALTGADVSRIMGEIPLGRVAGVDEIAAIATFCALDAPESMTGAVLDANGASYVR